jgi:hypothetical protein
MSMLFSPFWAALARLVAPFCSGPGERGVKNERYAHSTQ